MAARSRKALRARVGAMIKSGKYKGNVKAEVDRIRTDLKSNARIARYAGDFLSAQVEKVYEELTGKKLAAGKAVEIARAWHAHDHGHSHA